MATRKISGSKSTSSPASQLIDQKIAGLDDWRGPLLARVRALIHLADPDVVEEWKWGTPVWSHDGILCTGETYKAAVKLTFPKGASIPDPKKLFNSSLEGNTRRAIDLRENEKIDERALRALVAAAVAVNVTGKIEKVAKKKVAAKPPLAAVKKKVKKTAKTGATKSSTRK